MTGGNKMTYKCECGKEFSNSQAYNGHKGHCLEHLICLLGNYDSAVKKLNENKDKVINKGAKAAADKKKKKTKLARETKLNKWLSEKHTCENCGKVMTTYYGSGRFCSNFCARSFVSKQNREEKNLKISKSLEKGNGSETQIKRHCSICGKEIGYKNKSGYCINCIRKSPELKEYRINTLRYVSSFIQNRPGWQSRDTISYPEQFWIKVLDNNSIKYEHNKPVKNNHSSNYYLDFYIKVNDTEIDLEIDGKQHKYEDRIKSDIERNNYLESKGYIVYRIDWNEINSDQGKLLMKDKIDKFLEFYSNL